MERRVALFEADRAAARDFPAAGPAICSRSEILASMLAFSIQMAVEMLCVCLVRKAALAFALGRSPALCWTRSPQKVA